MNTRNSQRGFTLLEAIVAMVILASAGSALFAWLNTNLLTVNRIQAIQHRDEATRLGLEWMETVNPSNQPQGSVDFNGYRIQWQGQPLQPPRDGSGLRGGQSLFQVTLYQMQVRVEPPDRPAVEFTLRRTGYEQVRTPPFLE